MATPIVVIPQDKKPIVVSGAGKSGTPIQMNANVDWNKVEAIAADAAKEAVKEVSVDSQLSATSTNAVENRVVTQELQKLQEENEQLRKLSFAAL